MAAANAAAAADAQNMLTKGKKCGHGWLFRRWLNQFILRHVRGSTAFQQNVFGTLLADKEEADGEALALQD